MIEQAFQGPKGIFVLVDYIISLLALVSNLFVLDGIVRSPFILKGYRRFLISLTISDLYICFINLMFFIFQVSPLFLRDEAIASCGLQILRSLQLVGFFANLFNLCGMSVDHVIGLIYPLKYQYLTKKGMVKYAVMCVWVISFIMGFFDVPVAATLYLFGFTKRESSSMTGRNCTDSVHFQQLLNELNEASGGSSDLQSTWPSSTTLLQPHHDNPTFEELNRFNTTQVMMIFIKRRSAPSTPTFSNSYESGTDEGLMTSVIDDEIMNNLTEINDALCGALTLGGMAPNKRQQTETWCTYYKNSPLLEYCVIALTLTCFIFLAICYRKIFVSIFASSAVSKRKTSKLVVTTCFLMGAFAVCYLPFMALEFFMAIISLNVEYISFLSNSRTVLIVHNILNSLLLSYPLFDPIIYAARLPQVKRHIMYTLAHCCPCCRLFLLEQAARCSTTLMSHNGSFRHYPVARTKSEMSTTAAHASSANLRPKTHNNNNNSNNNICAAADDFLLSKRYRLQEKQHDDNVASTTAIDEEEIIVENTTGDGIVITARFRIEPDYKKHACHAKSKLVSDL